MKYSISLEGSVNFNNHPFFVFRVIGTPSVLEKLVKKETNDLYDVLPESDVTRVNAGSVDAMRIVKRGEQRVYLVFELDKDEIWSKDETNNSKPGLASAVLKSVYYKALECLENKDENKK